jgi:hypothetical protein
MPIIVVTADYCYDGRKHAKLPLHSGADVGQHSDDNDDDEPARLKPKERLRGIDIRRDSYNLADDMKDVYALKVIHVSEPSTTVSEHAKTTVIGENIYFDRDEKAMRELDDALRGKSKREAEEVEISEPSLIQRVRQYRSTNEKVIRSKQLTEQIKQSNKRIQNVKAGTKMRTEEYSLDECVKWALSYVFQHEDTLSAEVFEVMDEVERYEEMKRKLAGGKGVAIPKSNTKASKAAIPSRICLPCIPPAQDTQCQTLLQRVHELSIQSCCRLESTGQYALGTFLLQQQPLLLQPSARTRQRTAAICPKPLSHPLQRQQLLPPHHHHRHCWPCS